MLEGTWTPPAARAARQGAAASLVTAGASAIFAGAILAGSTLIFTVEPMFAKMVLPRAGGSPAVWNTCLVFFQIVLLAGYVYAHLSTTRLRLSHQMALHAALVVLAMLALPVAVPAGWTPPVDTTPIPWLLLTLAAGLGAPFFVLSATAPLLQKWFAGTDHPAAHDPYHLYAASNVGSLVALLAYPLVIEPNWSLLSQAAAWTTGYIVYGVLVAACALVALSRYRPANTPLPVPTAAVETDSRVTWAQRAEWLALSLVPSSLLLAVTTYISTDIAAVPLLWTVPLALYLLTFSLAFARAQVIPPGLVARLTPMLLTVLVVSMASSGMGSLVMIPVHLFVFFVCALRFHTALAERRPSTCHLTEFYLWVAAGGVLGGLANTFVAPLLFDSVVEYPAALAAACLLMPAIAGTDRRLTRNDIVLPLAVAAAAVALVISGRAELIGTRTYLFALGLLGVVSFSFSRRPLRFGLAMVMLLAVTQIIPVTTDRGLAGERTFFGVLRVRAEEATGQHVLLHGSTIHGRQYLDAARRNEPLSYYHRQGPIGQLMTALGGRLSSAEVGVVGLGAGSLAAYAADGQRWTFYEIDPAVARIAGDPSMFTYLDTCGARCRVVLGDARLSLARHEGPRYDLLLLDAFSSDAIPVHLLTREALDLYMARLAPGGVVAIHISNRHLVLRPMLAALAADRGLAALVQIDSPADSEREAGRDASEWLLLARDASAFGPLATDRRWERPAAPPGTRVWTDDFSDVVSVLRPRWWSVE